MARSRHGLVVAGVLSVLPMAWPLAVMGEVGEVERFVGLSYVLTPDARLGRQRLDLVTGTDAFAAGGTTGTLSAGSLTLFGSGGQASLHRLAFAPSWQATARIAVPLALTAAGVYVFAEAFLDDDDDDGDRPRQQDARDETPAPAAPAPAPAPEASSAGPLAQLLEERDVRIVINGEALD